MSNKTNLKKEDAIHYWTSFPIKDRPKAAILVGILTVAIAYILFQMFMIGEDQTPLYYFLGIFMWCIALMPFLVPTSYYFLENGIIVQYPFIKIEKLYEEYGCFYADKMGIMLSTFKMPRRLDAFRGQSIRFSKTQAERTEILQFLEEKIGKKY